MIHYEPSLLLLLRKPTLHVTVSFRTDCRLLLATADA